MAHWFVLPLLFIALGSFRRGWLYLLPLCLLLPAERSLAFDWDDLWLRKDQQAQRALEAGDAERAAELFDDPAWRGTAAYRGNDFEAAAEAFATQDSADSWYNRGNALAGQGRYDEAIAAYEKSLELMPGQEDAKRTSRPSGNCATSSNSSRASRDSQSSRTSSRTARISSSNSRTAATRSSRTRISSTGISNRASSRRIPPRTPVSPQDQGEPQDQEQQNQQGREPGSGPGQPGQ
jgi:Ca-activated chloride channel family protein